MYWHRWFALEDDNRAIGRAVTGAANLGFLFLVVGGFYLWWPRTWTRKSLRNVTWFRRGLVSKARDFNWHNVIGFWMAVPLLIIVFSGAMISYRWVGNLIYVAVGETPPSRGVRAAAAAPATAEPAPPARPAEWVSYQSILDRAAAESPGWRRLTVRIPDAGDVPLMVQVDHGAERQTSKRANLTFDQSSGTLTARASSQPGSRGQRIRSWLRFAHTGEVYGFVGQTIAGVASAGAIVLVWTGLALAWRRFFGVQMPLAVRRTAGNPAGSSDERARPGQVPALKGRAGAASCLAAGASGAVLAYEPEGTSPGGELEGRDCRVQAMTTPSWVPTSQLGRGGAWLETMARACPANSPTLIAFTMVRSMVSSGLMSLPTNDRRSSSATTPTVRDPSGRAPVSPCRLTDPQPRLQEPPMATVCAQRNPSLSTTQCAATRPGRRGPAHRRSILHSDDCGGGQMFGVTPERRAHG